MLSAFCLYLTSYLDIRFVTLGQHTLTSDSLRLGSIPWYQTSRTWAANPDIRFDTIGQHTLISDLSHRGTYLWDQIHYSGVPLACSVACLRTAQVNGACWPLLFCATIIYNESCHSGLDIAAPKSVALDGASLLH